VLNRRVVLHAIDATPARPDSLFDFHTARDELAAERRGEVERVFRVLRPSSLLSPLRVGARIAFLPRFWSWARRARRRLLAATQRPRLTTARLLSDSLTSVIKPARSLSSLRCLAKKYANANYAIISCGRAHDFIYLLQQPTTNNFRGSSPSSREKKLRPGSLAFGKSLAKPKLEGRIARQMLLFSKLSK